MDDQGILLLFEEIPSDNESITNESSDEENDILSIFDRGNVIEEFDRNGRPVPLSSSSRPRPSLREASPSPRPSTSKVQHEDQGLGLPTSLDSDDEVSDDSSSSTRRRSTNGMGIGPVMDSDPSERPSDDESDVGLDEESDDDVPLAVRINREGVMWGNTVRKFCKENFTATHGPCVDDQVESPVDVFLCLFPVAFIEHLVFQTNLYATQKQLATGGLFTPTNVDEMKTFIAINVLMGIKQLPSYKDYWSSHAELRDPYISSLMSRNRFSWLLGNIHINDNAEQPQRGEPDFDKLYKVRPLLDTLQQSFKTCFLPSKKQAIDESMIKFKGRSSIRQYMPQKPIKRGYKVWVRADESGFVCEFQIYTGKVDNATETKLGARVVKDLTLDIQGKGHNLCFDNFFASVDLMVYLQEHKIYTCSTVRKNSRGLPKDFTEDKLLKRGDSDWRASITGIVTLKWMDKKGILFLSNYHNPTDVASVNRKNKDGTIDEIDCPTLVKDYNATMGYVDKADMLKSLYEIDRKSKRWWLRIFWHFIDVSIVNAFIIFKLRSQGATMSLKHFRCAVANGLIGATKVTPDRGRKSQPPIQNRFKPYVSIAKRVDKAAHMPVRSTSRRCANCSSKNNPHRTKWMCVICEVGLCMNDTKNCFKAYHAK